MARARSAAGPVVVTGPGVEGKPFPTIGAALSYAMGKASQCVGDDCTWYIRGDGRNLAVTRDPNTGTVSYQELSAVTS